MALDPLTVHSHQGAGTTVAFGVQYHAQHLQKVGQIRDLMSSGKVQDDDQMHQMYLKSHGSFLPGEQRNRGGALTL